MGADRRSHVLRARKTGEPGSRKFCFNENKIIRDQTREFGSSRVYLQVNVLILLSRIEGVLNLSSREDHFPKEIQGKGLNPTEEAALRRYVRIPFDESLLPQAEDAKELILSAALIKCDKRCPINPCGICEQVFDRPTIVIDKLATDPPVNRVSVQWRGQIWRGSLPDDLQFRFQLNMKDGPENPRWMGHPELFNVAYLGLVGDWEPKSGAQKVADGLTKGHLGAPVVWVWSHIYTQNYPSGIGPASFAVPLISLGSDHGIVNPQRFTDFSWQQRASA